MKRLPAKDDADEVTKQIFEPEGQLIEEVTPLGATNTYGYSAFGDRSWEIKQIDQNKYIEENYEQDLRANTVKTSKKAGNIEINSTTNFDDPLNRPTTLINEINNRQTISYKGLRKQTIVNYADPNDPKSLPATKTITQDAFMRFESETDWSNTNLTKHQYDDDNRVRTNTSNGRTISETYNAFDEINKRSQSERNEFFKHGKDGQLEKKTYSDQSFLINTFYTNGLKETTQSPNGHKKRFENDEDQQPKLIVACEGTEARETHVTMNALGDDSQTTTARGLEIKREKQNKGLIEKIIKDPNNLHLQDTNYFNVGGALTKIEQGDNHALYTEIIVRDGLNREAERKIQLEHDKVFILNKQMLDEVGHVLETIDGNNNVKRHVFDSRGNERFIIDARGFVIEKEYNENQQVISERHYKNRFPENVKLTSKSRPADILAHLQPSYEDALKQFVYDSHQAFRYQIELVSQGKNGSKAKVSEYRRNDFDETVKFIEYSYYLKYSENGFSTTQVPEYVSFDNFIQKNFQTDPKMRITDYCRDLKGRPVFTRDGEGYIVENIYDVNGNVVMQVEYVDKYPNIDFSLKPDELRAILDSKNPRNRKQFYVYDRFDNLRYQIDGEGYIREWIYDKADQEIDFYAYYHPSTLTKLPQDEESAKLAALLSIGGVARVEIYKEIFEGLKLVTDKLADAAHDVQRKKMRDIADRLRKEIDGENNQTNHQPNALDLNESVIDRCGNECGFDYDLAKRLKKEISPEIEIPNIKKNEETGLIKIESTVRAKIETEHHYDNAGNEHEIIYAVGREDERKVGQTFDENNFNTGTIIKEIAVDAGIDVQAELNKRPEKNVDVSTKIITDFAGREIVKLDEENIPLFTVRDCAGRVCYHVDGDGYITEYVYEEAFNQPIKLLQHSKALDKSFIEKHKDGIHYAELKNIVDDLSSKDDRSIEFVVDRRGLNRKVTKDEIISANINGEKVTVALIKPTTTFDYNAFKQIITKETLINNSTWVTEKTYYDNNGNSILLISPKGYITHQIFGMPYVTTKNHGSILLNKFTYLNEYPKALSQTTCEDVLKCINPKDKKIAETYEYNRQLLEIKKMIEAPHSFYTSVLNEKGIPELEAVDNKIIIETKYDGEERPIALTVNGDTRHMVRDARGSIVIETDFPLITDPNKKKAHIPVVRHHVNAHQQEVATISFDNPITDEVVGKKPAEITLPPSSPKDDETIIIVDRRGNPTEVQKQSGKVDHTTFDVKRRSVRDYHWSTGYKKEQGQERPTPFKHFHERFKRYNNRGHIVGSRIREDNVISEIFKRINAFGECAEEGPTEDKMVVLREFDKSGFPWFTNEDKTKPTISFPDGRSLQIVQFRSAKKNLTDYLKIPETRVNLLDNEQSDYSKAFTEIQRTVSRRDLEGNVEELQKPWFSTKPKDVPENIQIGFNKIKEGSNVYITWPSFDEKLIHPRFRIRKKGDLDWKYLDLVNNENKVNVSSSPTDIYEYRVDFYLEDPDNKDIEKNRVLPSPTYTAEGEILLDTGIPSTSEQALWYMKDEKTLVLCGNLNDIEGIELIQNGNAVKKLGCKKIALNNYEIDLSNEITGDYEFRFVRGAVTKSQITVNQNNGNYQLNYYHPQYRFIGFPGSYQLQPSGLPPQIKTFVSDIQQGAVALPYHDHYNYNDDHYNRTIFRSATLPTANAWGFDYNGKPFFLGQFTSPARQNQLIDGNYFYGNASDLPPVAGEAFCLINAAPNAPIPHAIRACGAQGEHLGTYQLQPWANNTFIFPAYFINPNTKYFELLSLDESLTVETKNKINIKTDMLNTTMTSKELYVGDLNVLDYQVGGYFYQKLAKGSDWNFYYYDWKTNSGDQHPLLINQNGIQTYISHLNNLPKNPAGGRLNPMHFQFMWPSRPGPIPGPLGVNIILNDDIIPMGILKPSLIQSINGPRSLVMHADDYVQYDGRLIYEATYPNAYVLYFRPVPPNLGNVQIQYSEMNQTGERIWKNLETIRTQQGIVANLNAVAHPGHYYFQVVDFNGNVVNLESVGKKYTKEEGHGIIEVKKGVSLENLFISKNNQDGIIIKKPKVFAEHDRFHHATAVTQSGKRTESEFDIFNNEIKTTTPETTVVDNHATKIKKRLTTIRRVNKNNNIIGVVHPNNGIDVRFVNRSGDSLRESNAMNVYHSYTVDFKHRKRSSQKMLGPITYYDHAKLNNGLTRETKTLANAKTEIEFKNEHGHVIYRKDAIDREDFYDRNERGAETAYIHPLLMKDGKVKYVGRYQVFHPRTDVRLELIDEDGNTQTWKTGEKNSPEDFHAIVTEHTDFSNQKITYAHDYNQQVTKETGDISHVTKSRGLDERGQAVNAKNVDRIHDEAGHETNIIDNGAHLSTRKRYNEADQVEAYYFVSDDGRVYQATYTDYDELNRISRILDTRIALHIGYDEESNRRFARLYMIGDEHEVLLREYWYDYDFANRIILRDCLLNKDNEIVLRNEYGQHQGMSIHHDPNTGEIDQEQYDDVHGNLLTKSLIYNEQTGAFQGAVVKNQQGETVSSSTNIVDAAQRCTDLYQVKNVKVYIRSDRPTPNEYFQYKVPTYVFVLSKNVSEIYYYDNKTETYVDYDEIDNPKNSDKPFKKEARRFRGREGNSLSEYEKNRLTPYLYDHYGRVHGCYSHDHTDYQSNNAILKQHHETNASQQQSNDRDVTSTDAGYVKSEVNTFHGKLADGAKYNISDNTTTEHLFAESLKVQRVSTDRHPSGDAHFYNIPEKQTVETYQDSNSNTIGVKGALNENFRILRQDSNGMVFMKQCGDKRNYYFYAEKKPGKVVIMAYFGDIPDNVQALRKKEFNPPVVSVNSNALSSQLPPPVPAEFTIPEEMSFQQIADLLNYTGYEADLAQANGYDLNQKVPANTRIKIPPLYLEIPETAWNGTIPSTEAILGSLYPSVPMPIIEGILHKPNWFLLTAEAAVIAAIGYFAPPLLASAGGLVMSGGVVVATGTTTAATAALQTVAIYAATAAIASVTAQSMEMEFGNREKIDLNAVLIDTVTGALTAGYGGAMKESLSPVVGELGGRILTAETVALIRQALYCASHIDQRFDWKGLSTAIFNGLVNGGSENITNEAFRSALTTGVTVAGDSLIQTGRLDGSAISANIVGSFVGSMGGNIIGNKILQKQQERLNAMRRQETEVKTLSANTPIVHNNEIPSSKAPEPMDPDFDLTNPETMRKVRENIRREEIQRGKMQGQQKLFGEYCAVGDYEAEALRNNRQERWTGGKSNPKWAQIEAQEHSFSDTVWDVIDKAANSKVVTSINEVGDWIRDTKIMQTINEFNPFADKIRNVYAIGNALHKGEYKGAATEGLWSAVGLIPVIGKSARMAVEGKKIIKGGENVAKTVRFTELASGASKAEVRALLENSEQLGLTQPQIQKVKDLLGSGRMDGVTIKKMQSGDLRFAAERSGRTSGYQRMSFEITPQGQTTKVVQTAFDDANTLVRQRPGISKNNLYDVKKWKNKI